MPTTRDINILFQQTLKIHEHFGVCENLDEELLNVSAIIEIISVTKNFSKTISKRKDFIYF